MVQTICAWLYRCAFFCLLAYAIYAWITHDWIYALHAVAYYIPIATMFLMISGQMDLLEKIKKGELVNIKARTIDFIHWLLLTFMMVGRWVGGGITIWAFLLNVMLLAIIGWQVGLGIGRQWFPNKQEKATGIFMLMLASLLGLTAGSVRALDSNQFGWGWLIEVITAIISTLIVIWWIANDMRVIRKKASGYPRSFFLKGMFNNALAILVLWHLISLDQDDRTSWMVNLGFAFNVIVGNLIYSAYYFMWEYYHSRQSST